jgi:hypothetical protein
VTTARVTSADYRRPYRPRPIALLNRLGEAAPFGPLGGRLDADRLIAAARRRTGLTRFDGEAFREPLVRLLDAIEHEARLTATGRLITRTRLVGILQNRLRAQALFEQHPEILDERVEAPVFIVGLQRTGTTMLQRLLAADPGLRALASWEALNPAPLARRLWQRRDPRIDQAVRGEKGLRYLAPDFFAIHPVEAEAPEEEVILLDHSFLSTVAEAILRVPSFAAWLEEQDQTPAYEYLKKMLRLLQWQARADRWILKTPHHLEWLDTLLEVFPDARIVQTHRDPVKTLASFCSMIAHGRGVFSDEVDPHEVGAHWSRKTHRQIHRAMAARDAATARGGGAAFLDVSYYDLMADPMTQVQRIYDFIGRPLDEQVRDLMLESRRANPQYKHGEHRYRLEDFGLDRDRVEADFAAYRERHAIRRE